MNRAVRLHKYLAQCGRASRRMAERMMVAGRVEVNGSPATELGTQVIPGSDRVTVDGVPIGPRRIQWIALHKPTGVDTTSGDPHAKRTVYDLLPKGLAHLHYVGRLDRNTEGLLLMTNDGGASHRLQHPSAGIEREYELTVAGAGAMSAAGRLRRGVSLADGPARPLAVAFRATKGGGLIRLVLAEGRKREVRRMVEAVGLELHRLVRVRFGTVRLDGMPPGDWRELAATEVSALGGRRERGGHA